MRPIICISDLHLFSVHSEWRQHAEAVDAAAQDAAIIVLNGDTFELKWGIPETQAAIAARSLAWLEEFARRHAHAEVYLILGNHDHKRCFIDSLDPLCAAVPNLFWEPYHLRIGHALFLHGDACFLPTYWRGLAQARAAAQDKPAYSPWLSRTLSFLYRAGVPELASPVLYPERLILPLLLRYAAAHGHTPATGLEAIYFGHIHRAVNAAHGGVRFYNGGAAVDDTPFQILRLEAAGLVSNSASGYPLAAQRAGSRGNDET